MVTAPANAKYTSPDIQNQVIDVLGDHIQRKIIANVQSAKFLSVVADEVTDCSNKEQLSMVLRYVHPETLLIHEDLIQFVECDTDIMGRALADKMTSVISSLGLDLQYCVVKTMMEQEICLAKQMGLLLSSQPRIH